MVMPQSWQVEVRVETRWMVPRSPRTIPGVVVVVVVLVMMVVVTMVQVVVVVDYPRSTNQ